MQNTGNTAWSNAANFGLEVALDPCGLSPLLSLTISPTADVAPGQIYSFTGTLNGPASGGPCQIDLRMSEAATQFGPTVTQTLNVVDPVNGANILGSTIPAQMYPCQGLWVEVNVRNNGNTTWMKGGNYALNKNSDSCNLFAYGIQMLDDTPPSSNTPMLAYLVAPLTLGPCNFELQMTENPGTGAFGNKLNKTINVIVPPNAARDWTLFE